MRQKAHGLLIVFLLPLALFSAPQIAQSATYSNLAPADEYFGRLKMSILGIRNELQNLDRRVSNCKSQADEANVYHSASFVEDAMRDWSRKYPADPWLAKDYTQLTSLYARIHTNAGKQAKRRALRWLAVHSRRSTYTAYAKRLGE